MYCASNSEVTTITGVVETELKDYGSFTATLPNPIEITSNLDYAGIAIREVECLIPQEVLANQSHRLLAKRKNESDDDLILLKTYKANTVFNTVQQFIDFIQQGFNNFIVEEDSPASWLFGNVETTNINLNNYLKIYYCCNRIIFKNMHNDIKFLFIFHRHTQILSGTRWGYTHIPPMSLTYSTCYLSIDNYNANEFLIIEMNGIERTITKNGSEPILVSFYCHNNGSGHIHFTPEPNIEYKKIEKLGPLRELNFHIKPVLEERPNKNFHFLKKNRYTVDPSKNCSVRIKYEILLVGSP